MEGAVCFHWNHQMRLMKKTGALKILLSKHNILMYTLAATQEACLSRVPSSWLKFLWFNNSFWKVTEKVCCRKGQRYACTSSHIHTLGFTLSELSHLTHSQWGSSLQCPSQPLVLCRLCRNLHHPCAFPAEGQSPGLPLCSAQALVERSGLSKLLSVFTAPCNPSVFTVIALP